MEMKALYKAKDVQEVNQLAEEMRRLNQLDKLKKLAQEYQVLTIDVEDYIIGKRYFLIDAGDSRKSYVTERAKIMDEMLTLSDPMFGTVIGSFLLENCKDQELEEGILLEHKTLQRCISYLMKRAYDTVDEEHKNARRPMGIACRSDDVYQWIREYYLLDDRKALEAEKEKAERSFCSQNLPKTKSSASKPAKKKSPKKEKTSDKAPNTEKKDKAVSPAGRKAMEGQGSLFDLVSEEENS